MEQLFLRMKSSSETAIPMDLDARFLRRQDVPPYEISEHRFRVVDLFCGCGGMALGIAEAARRAGHGIDVRLAVDADSAAATVFQALFPSAEVQTELVEFFFDGVPGEPPTDKEQGVRDAVGEVDFLVGGPPCQGHSDLNNHTRRDDERNALYLLMARAAEVLKPRVVVIENVPSVLNDKRLVVSRANRILEALGYVTFSGVVDLLDFGLPQRRRRHVLLGLQRGLPSASEILRLRRRQKPRPICWAMADLNGAREGDLLHTSYRISPENTKRIAWLFANDKHDLPNAHRPTCHRDFEHTYKSVYGRLWWNRPAQTITTGFTSMGQGRFVHPLEQRTLTPREAARLQFLPDFVPFEIVKSRTAWATMIGNAVPPKLMMELVRVLLPFLHHPTEHA